MQMLNDSATAAYCVFGNPIAHSKSPLIHRLFAQQTGQAMTYEARLAALDGFSQAVQEFVEEGGLGANVTVPFKLEAFTLCDYLSERALSAGAVNTLRFVDGRIEGDNTDGAGLVRDIVVNAGFPIQGKRVLIIGAGGAARGALLPLLEQQPHSVVVINRTFEKALELAALAGQWKTQTQLCIAKPWDELEGEFDLVINASSASLQGAVLQLPKLRFASQSLAYDMMYSAELTPFLQQAKQAGAQVRDGIGMLIEQAAEAFFVWRQVRPETAPVFTKLRQGDGQ